MSIDSTTSDANDPMTPPGKMLHCRKRGVTQNRLQCISEYTGQPRSGFINTPCLKGVLFVSALSSFLAMLRVVITPLARKRTLSAAAQILHRSFPVVRHGGSRPAPSQNFPSRARACARYSSVVNKDASTKQVADLLAVTHRAIVLSQRNAAGWQLESGGERVGAQALDWLKQCDSNDQTHVPSVQLLRDLSWLLVAEGNSKSMIDFLLAEGRRWQAIDFHDAATRKDNIGRLYQRRHQLFTAVIQAHLQLSPDADSAIECFRTILNNATRDRILHVFCILGAKSQLGKALRTSSCSPCNEELFDWFVAAHDLIERPEEASASMAWLKLFHPTSPHPWPAFTWSTEEVNRSAMNRLKRRSRKFHARMLGRAIFLLRLQGASEQAGLVEATLESQFYIRPRLREEWDKSCERDPKLRHLLQKGTR